MRVAGKTLVVIGAGGALGRAVTVEAIRRGARVAAVDADPAALAETARQVVAPLLLSTHVADGVEGLPAVLIARWSAVDGLIHCAGDPDQVVRTFLPLLRARPEAHLVTIGDPGGDRAAAKRFAAAHSGTGVRAAMVFPVGEAAYQAARDVLDGMARDSYPVLVGAERRSIVARVIRGTR
ncbi:SDR family NAD(P)-dependent oxidoreductase [Actinoplanes sp. L3-i22]|uniref:SDR family NAD(P)-dependent oxidoreductase n=1 Tax=Actinoplanes sp. L3-i22 TaxID=2836373 RepID=UPI001C799D4B|nr:SDR family NAD(P)-dependent oxidoreductase [Actinoplanes sp. L3-i22]BCY07035.1 short-chain dehydrogenase [Actinoplanes sp. L3-i22]